MIDFGKLSRPAGAAERAEAEQVRSTRQIADDLARRQNGAAGALQ
jgi:hypothetical protein